jgi:predicted metal-dependent hydrolase
LQSYPQPYIDYLVQFHADHDYFECHEILEEHWKENPQSPFNRTWVGLIQVAVALYHERRGNLPGARKMGASALNILAAEPLDKLGIGKAAFLSMLQERLELLQHEPPKPFSDMNIPLADPELLRLCLELSKDRGRKWQSPVPVTDPAIIHRHTLRDRSSVIKERENQYMLKTQARQQGNR